MHSWDVPRGPLELNNDEIHLWRVDLDRHMNALPALTQTLAPEEVTKASQFRLERDSRRYVVAHGALRTILARYLKTTPGEPVFRYGPHGKPELASGRIRFNMSHSDDLVVCAISRACDVGVDVERVPLGVDGDLFGRSLSLRALRPLAALPRPQRSRAFFKGWTRMEAYVKARGEGLESGVDVFEVFLKLNSPGLLCARDDAGQETRWWLQDFCPRRGYVAALAARDGKRMLRNWKWRAEDIVLEPMRSRQVQPRLGFRQREVNDESSRTGTRSSHNGSA